MHNSPRRRLSLVLVWMFACGLTTTGAVGRPPDQGGAQAGPVRLDFRANTEDGTPILDLKPADVSLKINGRQKEIKSLELVQITGAAGAATAAAAVAPPFASNAAGEPGRDVILAIDDDSIAAGKESQLREAVAQLLPQVTSRDRVGLMSLRPGGLNVALTAQPGVVSAAATGIVGGAPGTESADNFTCRGRRVLDALKTLLAAPSDRPVVIVFLSASMSGPVAERRATADTSADLCQLTTANFQQFTVTANASRTALYVVQLVEASGEVRNGQGSTTDPQSMIAGLEAVAAASANDIIRPVGASKSALTRVFRETAAHYVATFDADASDRTGSSLRVELKVTRDRARVRARPDIVLAKADPKAAKPNPKDMLRVATVYRDLPIRAVGMSTQNPGTTEIKVVALFEATDPSAKIVAASVGLFDEKSTLKKQWSAQDSDLGRVPVMAALTAPPGKYRMRVATVDAAGRAGTADYDLAAGLTAADPLKLSAMSLGTTAGGSFALKLLFTNDPAAIGYLEIYGVPKGGNVTVKYEIATSEDGAPLGTGDGVVRPGSAEDVRNAFGGFPIDTLEPGDYVLRAVVSLDGKPVGRVWRTLRKGP